MKTTLSAINSSVPQVSLLICSSSFESRWFQVAKSLTPNGLDKIVILHKGIESPTWEDGISEIESHHGQVYEVVDITKSPATETWKILTYDILPMIRAQEGLTLIDITTLTCSPLA